MILITALILIAGITYSVLENKRVQTMIGKALLKELSVRIGAPVRVGEIDIDFFSRLVFRDVYIEDLNRDTLLYAEIIRASVADFKPGKRKIRIRKISSKGLQLNISRRDSAYNFSFILDSLKGNRNKKAKPWNVNIQNILIGNSGIRYKDLLRNKSYDFEDLMVDMDIGKRNNGYILDVKKFEIEDRHGVEVKSLKTIIKYTKNILSAENFLFVTEESSVSIPLLRLRHNGSFRNFVDSVDIEFDLRQAEIAMSEFARYFNVNSGKEKFLFAGSFSGPVSQLQARNLQFVFGEKSYLEGDFSTNGLPGIDTTYIYLDIKDISSNAGDIGTLLHVFPAIRGIDPLVGQLSYLGTLNYSGIFQGFLNDFVAFGKLRTDIGNFDTDLLFRPAENNANLLFDGNLGTEYFNLGAFTNTDNLGELAFHFNVEGSINARNELMANISGNLDSIVAYGYKYKHIEVDGLIKKRQFNGSFEVADTNLNLSFTGQMDFENEAPELNFIAHVNKAHLSKLNLSHTMGADSLSFVLNTDIVGGSIDDLEGYARFFSFDYRNKRGRFALDSAVLYSSRDQYGNRLTFTSPVLEGEIDGDFNISSLGDDFKYYLSNYLPAIFKSKKGYMPQNTFNADLKFKEHKNLSKVFFPEYAIADSSYLFSHFSSENSVVDINFISDSIVYNNIAFEDIRIVSFSGQDSFGVDVSSGLIHFADNYSIENFTAHSNIHKNTADLILNWKNSGLNKVEGNIKTHTNFIAKEDGSYYSLVNFDPSVFIINDTIWNLLEADIKIDSTFIHVDHFKFFNGNKFFEINGIISERPDDEIRLTMNRFRLGYLQSLAKLAKLSLRGEISGTARAKNIYSEPLFFASIDVDNFEFNQTRLGDLRLESNWNNVYDRMDVLTVINSGLQRPFYSRGFYQPAESKLSMDAEFDRFNIEILRPFLNNALQDVYGHASGNASITIAPGNVSFNASLMADTAGFRIDYLKTEYHFSDRIILSENSIDFGEIEVYDDKNNIALFSGKIEHDLFKKMKYDLNISPRKFMGLNTRHQDNSRFYGRAFVSGVLHIGGAGNNLNLNASLRSEEGSWINIPLQSESMDLYASEFLTFVKDGKLLAPSEFEVNDFSYEGLSMNLDLQVSSNTDIQIIFDSRIGDVIKAEGNGNLNLELSEDGEFDMFGMYTIEKGDYLFTLQNVINKRFLIKEGGAIIWSGDPYNADINLTAAYNTKASLHDLMVTGSEDSRYRSRVPVVVELNLQDKLLQPYISFNIELPYADDEVNQAVGNMINTPEEINKQVLSLLVLNQFYTETGSSGISGFQYASTDRAAAVTASELLSNQLSNWLSQISDNWNIGLAYRPGDEISSQEIEVALTTQIFNNRVILDGNVGVGNYENTTSNIVGDFNVEIKLNESGNLRLKGFTRSNDNLIYETSPTTQGIGVFYREDFDNFSNLLDRYWNKVFQSDSVK